jgi:hypothetical protein
MVGFRKGWLKHSAVVELMLHCSMGSIIGKTRVLSRKMLQCTKYNKPSVQTRCTETADNEAMFNLSTPTLRSKTVHHAYSFFGCKHVVLRFDAVSGASRS